MNQEVIMYTLPLCPYCAAAKRFLSGRGILFLEKNILLPKHLKELRNTTKAIGVPVTIVGERILTRFSSTEYEEVFRNY
ncbi:glutaredoxin family protein [Desulfosporosinus sp.]|uniref:glutaredoxin family protein n=1 Tax=Desulfosporosinus sp. TaxID=157907 RepID=UPI00232350E4|nr:glutaredoxin family protein [Desulfosporosinus sp.]MCO5384886.1 glutaredoxin family protein [Desulfosporosinus sp.]MDA8222526.1 glutaredoxin family protein [Desulfitobacterium hafniense]